MGSLDLLFHVLGFIAPAFAVGLLVALASRFVLPRSAQGLSWWVQSAINTIAGVVVLVAGLAWFGVDGKMATYAGLVLAVATLQWVCNGGWKGRS